MTDLFERFSEATKRKFKKFHAENPHVYDEFRSRVFRMRATGRTRYSARTIMESMRWDYHIVTTGKPFKISNDFIPVYARLLIHRHPEFRNFFSLKGEGDDDEYE